MCPAAHGTTNNPSVGRAAPSPPPGVVPHLRRREGTPPYGQLAKMRYKRGVGDAAPYDILSANGA